MTDKKAILIIKAKLAEQIEDYNDMAKSMAETVHLIKRLNNEERNLLSVAYKNKVGEKKSAWVTLSKMEWMPTEKNKSELTNAYRLEFEKEIKAICDEILNLLNTYLIPNTTDSESLVLYLKMKGDYYKCIAEISTEKTRDTAVADSLKAYKEAVSKTTNLSTCHPIRLGLMLHYSIFQYEILNDSKEASKIAKKAFDDAISELDSLKEDSYKDSTLIMQLLRDNLTLWASSSD